MMSDIMPTPIILDQHQDFVMTSRGSPFKPEHNVLKMKMYEL